MSDKVTPVDSLKDLLDNARSIVVSPAFTAWKEQMMAQREMRIVKTLEPLADAAGVYEQEYTKGEANGMLHAIRQWELMISYFEGELQQKIDDQEEK